MTNFVLNSPPAQEPITLNEAKTHLKVTHDISNTYIQSLMVVAREYTEKHLGRYLIEQQWDAVADYFPGSKDKCRYFLKPGLVSVDEIKYIDEDGVEQTLATTEYQAVKTPIVGYVQPAYEKSWPATRDIPEAVTVTFKAGYGQAASDVPTPIKQAILMLIGHLHQNRELIVTGAVISTIPMAYESLLQPYVVPSV